MGKGKNLSIVERTQIITLRNEKLSIRKIAERLKISKTAVFQAIKAFNETKTIEKCVRKRRPRKTTEREDRIVHRISEADRHKTTTEIKHECKEKTGIELSSRTIGRRLNEFGLMGRVCRSKPLISEKNRRARLAFAKKYRTYSSKDWARIIFTDESKFNRLGSDGKTYVRRRPGEEFTQRCTKPTVKGGGGSVMVWGAMTLAGTGPIHRIQGIMDQHVYIKIINDICLPFLQKLKRLKPILQADNDPKHTSKRAKEFLSKKKIQVLEWPSQSPDLNPIEMLWCDVDKHIKLKKPKNLNELAVIIEEGWAAIPPTRCAALVDSMPRRLDAVIAAKGRATKY